MANFTVNGEINANRAAAAYQELSKMVEGRNYNLGELVLDKNGKLTKVNHHASGWFANDRITSEEENENVRKAVDAAIRQHWAGATDEKKILLDEISNHLTGDKFKSLPLTRREVCAYLKMMGGYLTGEDQNALEKKAGEIKFKLNEDFENLTDVIEEVHGEIAELTSKQNRSQDEADRLDELDVRLRVLIKEESGLRRKLSDENVKASALKWLLKGKVSRAYGAEHGQFGYLRQMLDKVGQKGKLAKNSVAGFIPSQNVLQGNFKQTQSQIIRSQCHQKLMIDDGLQGEERSEMVKNTVLSAFIQDAHFNVVAGTNKRPLLLGKLQQTDWNVSTENGMDDIRNLVSKFTIGMAGDFMKTMAPKLDMLARYKGEKPGKIQGEVLLALQTSIDGAFSELDEKMSDLINEFEQRLPKQVSKNEYKAMSGTLARDDSSQSVGYEKLLDDMAALVNDFTEKALTFGTKDGLAGIISQKAEEAVREKRFSRENSAKGTQVDVVANRQKIPEIQRDIDFLRNFTGTSLSIDALNEQLDQYNNTYVKSQRSGSKTDEQLFSDFKLKRNDDGYLAALSSKMKPLLGKYTSKSEFKPNQDQLAVMLPSEPEDIKNALGLFSIEDLREKVGSLKDKEFQTFYLRAGLDADQLLEFVDFGFAFLSDDRIVTFRDALRNMSARISELSTSNKREDLVEAGKLLTSLKQMRIRMGRVLELTKDVRIPDRTEQEKKFAITEKLSEAVSMFTVKEGSYEEDESVDSENMSGVARSDSDIAIVMQKNATHVEGVKETRVAVNDALVNQLESLRKFCEPLSAVFAKPVNGGNNWIDVDALERKLVNSANQFNQEGLGKPIDFAKEVPVDAKQQAEWNAYAKNLTSFAVQQLSPNALTGGPLKYDPNFSGYPQIKIDTSKI